MEAHRRGTTLYAPDRRTPLHPPVLSEGAASLLPDEVRPALLWTLQSGRQWPAARRRGDPGTGSEPRTAGLRPGAGRDRRRRTAGDPGPARRGRDGGASSANGTAAGSACRSLSRRSCRQPGTGQDWRLAFRAPLPVEGWNAQISLLTGMAAAHLMLYGQVGILRTMPPADPGSLRRLRQTAKALRIPWPAELDYPEFVRSLDPRRAGPTPRCSTACTMLFRGAGYRAFSGGVPDDVEHAALAIDYAHVTAPLRRLVDRYAGEVCLALCAGVPVPGWVLRALDALPQEMADGGPPGEVVRAGRHRPDRGLPARRPGGGVVHRDRDRDRPRPAARRDHDPGPGGGGAACGAPHCRSVPR